MEIGNMLFGNSRGRYPMGYDEKWKAPWRDLCDRLAIAWRGYPDKGCKLPLNTTGDIETDTFLVKQYDWGAKCDCGANAAMDDWYEKNSHASDCYQMELQRRMDEYDRESGYNVIRERALGSGKGVWGSMNMEKSDVLVGDAVVGTAFVGTPRTDEDYQKYRDADDVRDKYEESVFQELTTKHALPMLGCAVHCTCGRDDRASEYWTSGLGRHTGSCRLVQPNFLYKPTGFRINWYKYPFRDSYMSHDVSNDEWRKFIAICIESAEAAGFGVPQLAIDLSKYQMTCLELSHCADEPYVVIAEDEVEVTAVRELMVGSLLNLRSMQRTKSGAWVYMVELTEKGDKAMKATWANAKVSRGQS